MPFVLSIKKVEADPNAPASPGMVAWIQAHGPWIIGAVGIAKYWCTATYGHPWSKEIDDAINATLLLVFGGAVHTAMGLNAAEVANAHVNPQSPRAKQFAARITPPQGTPAP